MTSSEESAVMFVFLAEGMSGVDFPSVSAEPPAPGRCLHRPRRLPA